MIEESEISKLLSTLLNKCKNMKCNLITRKRTLDDIFQRNIPSVTQKISGRYRRKCDQTDVPLSLLKLMSESPELDRSLILVRNFGNRHSYSFQH